MKSPITWVGNKTAILPILYKAFPLDYSRYVECFGGSASVLLGKPRIDKFEVYNDFNHDLYNLMHCIKEKPAQLIRELQYMPIQGREPFSVLRAMVTHEEYFMEEEQNIQDEVEAIRYLAGGDPQGEEMVHAYLSRVRDLEVRKAAAYLQMLRGSFSSTGKSYSCQPTSLRAIYPLIKKVARRLENVMLENKDFGALIKQYDQTGTFFYLDPPYVETESFYDVGFGWGDHLRLRNQLGEIQGKFLLSYNDCTDVRQLYEGFHILDFDRAHPMSKKPDARFPELLIANYDLYEQVREEPTQMALPEMTEVFPQIDVQEILKGRMLCKE